MLRSTVFRVAWIVLFAVVVLAVAGCSNGGY
jgi:hypothetical protein